MDTEQVLETANKSERVRELLATTIQVGVHKVLAYRMSLADAKDLARVHTLPTALERIRQKSEVHQEIRDRNVRFHLAVLEAKLEGVTTGGSTEPPIEHVIKIRQEIWKILKQSAGAHTDHQATVSDLLHLSSEISEWGKSYRKFLRGLWRLYRRRRQEVSTLTLNAARRQKALSELDDIFLSAIESSAKVFQSPKTATTRMKVTP